MNAPGSEWRSVLTGHANALRRAFRHPVSPGCDLVAPDTTPAQRRGSLLSVPIQVSAAGDNQIISTLIGKKLIYEIVLWNVTAQTLKLYAGPSATGILLLPLTNFPALTGFTLGFNGNFEQPHFEIDPGKAFVLNLQNATEVDGMVRYRVATDSF